MDNDILQKEKEWEIRKNIFYQNQQEHNLKIISLKQDYLLKNKYAINNYNKLIELVI
ncbi:hypothetical protein [Flavobacterium undicola]|uniref:hypothetical protein n=1 Tax=Flavobacterium undicola TaxID=1932779 RepID=UPI001377BB1C|nr:hypothetical protein [Flavobacterium undicola]MBA0885607.1 hypothetical protein [Flavobacterium undicola]